MGKVFLAFLFLFVSVVGCYSQTQDLAGKEGVADQYSWDFGQAREGELLRHEFLLKNDSQKTLNIKEVTTSCGCTVSEVKKKTLQAGEDALLEVKFNTKGYFGTVQQFAYAHTDSLERPIIKFTIKATIVKK